MSTHNFVRKFDRARKHLQDLDVAESGWFNGDHHRIWSEPDPNGALDQLLKASADPIPTDPFSLLISDAVQNFRIGLEHLAFHLAERNAKRNAQLISEEIAKDSQFIIVGNENSKGLSADGQTVFDSQKKRIRGIEAKAQAVMRGLQPYHLKADYRTHPLWRLGELSNIDKHRMLHVTAAKPSGWIPGAAVTFWPSPKETRIQMFPEVIVEQGTVVTVMSNELVTQFMEQNPEVDVPFKVRLNLAFADDPFRGMPVVGTLREINDFILTKLLVDLAPYI